MSVARVLPAFSYGSVADPELARARILEVRTNSLAGERLDVAASAA